MDDIPPLLKNAKSPAAQLANVFFACWKSAERDLEKLISKIDAVLSLPPSPTTDNHYRVGVIYKIITEWKEENRE